MVRQLEKYPTAPHAPPELKPLVRPDAWLRSCSEVCGYRYIWWSTRRPRPGSQQLSGMPHRTRHWLPTETRRGDRRDIDGVDRVVKEIFNQPAGAASGNPSVKVRFLIQTTEDLEPHSVGMQKDRKSALFRTTPQESKRRIEPHIRLPSQFEQLAAHCRGQPQLVRIIARDHPGWRVKLKDIRWFVPITVVMLGSAEKFHGPIKRGRIIRPGTQQPIEPQPGLGDSGKRPLNIIVKPLPPAVIILVGEKMHQHIIATGRPSGVGGQSHHQLGPIAAQILESHRKCVFRNNMVHWSPLVHVVLRNAHRGGAPRLVCEGVLSLHFLFYEYGCSPHPGRSDSKNLRKSVCSSERSSIRSPVAGCSNPSRYAWRKCRVSRG